MRTFLKRFSYSPKIRTHGFSNLQIWGRTAWFLLKKNDIFEEREKLFKKFLAKFSDFEGCSEQARMRGEHGELFKKFPTKII